MLRILNEASIPPKAGGQKTFLRWVLVSCNISFDNNLQAHDVLPEFCTSWRLLHYYFNLRKTQKIKPVPISYFPGGTTDGAVPLRLLKIWLTIALRIVNSIRVNPTVKKINSAAVTIPRRREPA
jgi:hypothetical protein